MTEIEFSNRLEELHKELAWLDTMYKSGLSKKQEEKPTPPEGFVLTGEFREVRIGDYIIPIDDVGSENPRVIHVWQGSYITGERWILRKLKKWVFVETGEVREAKFGEWVLGKDAQSIWYIIYPSNNKYKILKLQEEE